MFTFILWCLLFICCWPLALGALVIFPLVWLVLLPFQILGFAVGAVLQAVWALATLPFKILGRVF